MHALVLLLPGLLACGSSEVVPLDADARIAALESVVADQEAALARIDALEATVTAQDARIAELEAAVAQGGTGGGSERLDALDGAVAALATDVAGPDARLVAVEDGIGALTAFDDSLTTVLDDIVARLGGHDFVVSSLDGRVSTLESLAATPVEQELLTDLSAYVTVDTAASTVRISGANLQVVNGTSNTQSANGLGNLILGYNEDVYGYETSGMREGSHSLVVGVNHAYTSYGSIVHGDNAYVTGAYAAALGVYGGSAEGARSVLLGGWGGYAAGEGSFVAGGQYNVAYGTGAAAVGGYSNAVYGAYASALGGSFASVDGDWATSVGGASSRAAGDYSVTVGGNGVRTSVMYDVALP